jgi:hypothetical protein
MQEHLNNHHRETLRKIFSHPTSGNLEWRQVLSLLEAVGTAHEEHNGKVKVTLGPETEVVVHPRGKDVDKQMVVDLRRMLDGAGYSSPTLASPPDPARASSSPGESPAPGRERSP